MAVVLTISMTDSADIMRMRAQSYVNIELPSKTGSGTHFWLGRSIYSLCSPLSSVTQPTCLFILKEH